MKVQITVDDEVERQVIESGDTYFTVTQFRCTVCQKIGGSCAYTSWGIILMCKDCAEKRNRCKNSIVAEDEIKEQRYS